MLRFDQLAQAQAPDAPFRHVVGEALLGEGDRVRLAREFPDTDKVGFYPVEDLTYGPAFAELLDDLASPAFSAAVGGKLGVDLTARPRMVVVRKWSALRDGRPHTDGPDKAATALLYLNDDWDGAAGSLRYLEGPDLEGPGSPPVPARYGAFTAFARSECSWHGHLPFEGERRVVQLFWLVDEAAAARKQRRHKRADFWKGLFPRRAAG